MRNFVYAAVFAALGFNMTSCDVDGLESENPTTVKKMNQSEFMVSAKEGDTIFPELNTNDTDPGPGDDPIIVPPPPKP